MNLVSLQHIGRKPQSSSTWYIIQALFKNKNSFKIPLDFISEQNFSGWACMLPLALACKVCWLCFTCDKLIPFTNLVY